MSREVKFDEKSLVKSFVLTTKEGKQIETVRFTINGKFYAAFNHSGCSPKEGQLMSDFLRENWLNLVESTYINKSGVETTTMDIEAPLNL